MKEKLGIQQAPALNHLFFQTKRIIDFRNCKYHDERIRQPNIQELIWTNTSEKYDTILISCAYFICKIDLPAADRH